MGVKTGRESALRVPSPVAFVNVTDVNTACSQPLLTERPRQFDGSHRGLFLGKVVTGVPDRDPPGAGVLVRHLGPEEGERGRQARRKAARQHIDGSLYCELMVDDATGDPEVERIEQWEHGFEERAARARALAERMSGLSATAHAGDGIVEVTVGSAGQITGLRLDEEIRRQPAAVTTRQILAAIGAAKASLARDFARVAAETVGLESVTGQAVMNSLNARLGLSERPDDDPDKDIRPGTIPR